MNPNENISDCVLASVTQDSLSLKFDGSFPGFRQVYVAPGSLTCSRIKASHPFASPKVDEAGEPELQAGNGLYC